MAVFANSTLAPVSESVPVLIFANGRLNHAAIAAEIDRRMVGCDPRTRDYYESQVRDLASRQRWPLVDRAIEAEWSEAEHEEYWALQDAKHSCPISARGNDEYAAIALRQDRIYRAVERRALAKIDGEVSCLPLAA